MKVSTWLGGDASPCCKDDRGRRGTALPSNACSYDGAGNVLTNTRDGVATTCTYDDIDQLTGESRTGYACTYTYDANGNRLTKTLNGTTENYTYDGADKMLTAGARSYGYDAAGRRTSVTVSNLTTTLTYDYENRVSQITFPNSTTNTFTYNGLDTRVGKVDSMGMSTYKRDGVDVTDPVVNDGSASYTPGVSERRSGASKFWHSGLRNVDSQSSASQNLAATRQYDAFGNVVSSTGTWSGPFGYAGDFGYQEDPDSGLKLLGHRYYDPSTGRFLTRDRAKQGRNWYAYCNSNPLCVADPRGYAVVTYGVGVQACVPLLAVLGPSGSLGVGLAHDTESGDWYLSGTSGLGLAVAGEAGGSISASQMYTPHGDGSDGWSLAGAASGGLCHEGGEVGYDPFSDEGSYGSSVSTDPGVGGSVEVRVTYSYNLTKAYGCCCKFAWWLRTRFIHLPNDAPSDEPDGLLPF